MKTYELPLTRDYVRSWTAVEAIRELTQNALDHRGGALHGGVGDNFASIISYGAKLESKTLLLGCTSKADDAHSIGSFGEGYKIALLVLAREGLDVKVWNNDVVWIPRFGLSATFGEEVLL